MNILHYSLGFPPFRRGGMTQYCLDMMKEQFKAGNDVSLLWPGELHNSKENVKLKRHRRYYFSETEYCDSIEIVNPLLIPLMDGIVEPQLFMQNKDIDAFNVFFKESNYDVLHIHTFMGMPIELVKAAKAHNVVIVFTSHDYFPLCPRCNLFYEGHNCEVNNYANCVDCNKNGLSYNKMLFLQSNFYKFVKNWKVIQSLRKQHNRNMYIMSDNKESKKIKNIEKERKYLKLKNRNIELLDCFDVIHFNSENTLQGYKLHGYNGNNFKVISITNSAIQNHKQNHKANSSVRFGYLGPITTHKGYNLLRDACDSLWNSGFKNFEMHYFAQAEDRPYVKLHEPYSYEELPHVMNSFDVLITPSICGETFGFTVLEALSYGVPVVVSKCVGAKDLIHEGENGYIVDTNVDALYGVLVTILQNPDVIDKMNKYIVKYQDILTMQRHCADMTKLYEEARRNGKGKSNE